MVFLSPRRGRRRLFFGPRLVLIRVPRPFGTGMSDSESEPFKFSQRPALQLFGALFVFTPLRRLSRQPRRSQIRAKTEGRVLQSLFLSQDAISTVR